MRGCLQVVGGLIVGLILGIVLWVGGLAVLAALSPMSAPPLVERGEVDVVVNLHEAYLSRRVAEAIEARELPLLKRATVDVEPGNVLLSDLEAQAELGPITLTGSAQLVGQLVLHQGDIDIEVTHLKIGPVAISERVLPRAITSMRGLTQEAVGDELECLQRRERELEILAVRTTEQHLVVELRAP